MSWPICSTSHVCRSRTVTRTQFYEVDLVDENGTLKYCRSRDNWPLTNYLHVARATGFLFWWTTKPLLSAFLRAEECNTGTGGINVSWRWYNNQTSEAEEATHALEYDGIDALYMLSTTETPGSTVRQLVRLLPSRNMILAAKCSLRTMHTHHVLWRSRFQYSER